MMCGGRQSLQQQHAVYSRLKLAELFLTDVKNVSVWSINGRNKSAELTRGRAAGKLANMNGQRGNVVEF